MNLFRILNALASLYYLVENFLKFKRNQDIIEAKNEALETGDQRELEKLLSNSNANTDITHRAGMQERPYKNKRRDLAHRRRR